MRHSLSSGTKQWYQRTNCWLLIIITLLICMLIAGCDIPGISSNGNNNGVGNGNSAPCNGINVCNTTNNSSSSGPSGTQPGGFAPTPTPSPTPTPVPSPTPCHNCVIYQANWSNGLDGWTQSDGWATVNGMLVNDGSDYNNDGHPTAIAPSLPQGITNYSVQADIRLDKYSDTGGISALASFGIVVRSPDEVGGYKIGACASAGIYSCGNAAYEILLSDGSFLQDTPVQQFPFQPTYGTWNTYRVDVQGNTITVWLNGSQIFSATDDKYLSAGSVGLWSDRCQISVRNFKITAL